MNRSLDERIHDLYTELVADAPTAPPLPSPTSAPAPARATAWPRILAGAAVTLVIAGVGAVVVMSDVSSDTAPSGAAATAAPTQERSRVDITFLVDVPVEVVPDARPLVPVWPLPSTGHASARMSASLSRCRASAAPTGTRAQRWPSFSKNC